MVDMDKDTVKAKMDALAWHGRALNLISVSHIQEALMLFKRTLLPSDNNQRRSMYIKTIDHNSNSVEHMAKVIKQVSL